VSSIGAVSGAVQPTVVKASAVSQKAAAAVLSVKKDSDGDFDGTKPGQIDPKDAGKGLKIDSKA
jgi:hypothetical protein